MKALLLFLGAASLFLPVAAQSLSYSLLPRGEGEVPSERVDGVIVYDPPGRQILLFGGQDFSGPRNDLWSYSIEERRWTSLAPSDTAKPAPRFGHTVVFDALRRRLILFGGQSSGFFSDVWAYDVGANTWTQLARDDAGGPSRRYGHSAIYETARDRVVISHGFTNAGRFDDTWSFELATNTWRNISPSSGRPLRRCLHHAVYDAARGEMLLYGGCSSGSGPCPQADLWSFDLAAQRWTERVADPRPEGREHYGLAFDSRRSRMIVFGGNGTNGARNDTWEFDPMDRRWQRADIAGDLPGVRSRHQGAENAGNLYFFGGSNENGFSNELWMLGPPATPAPSRTPRIISLVNVFSSEGDGVSPGEVVRIDGLNLDDEDGLVVMANGFAARVQSRGEGYVIAQMPLELSGAVEAKVVVTLPGRDVGEAWTVPVRPVHPGLWATISNAAGEPIGSDRPASPGDEVVLLATGVGSDGIDATLEVRIGDRVGEVVQREGVPDASGLLRILVRIPPDSAEGELPVTIAVAGAESQRGVVIFVRARQSVE